MLLAVPLTFLLHEWAHWLAALALGYEPALRINSVYLVGGTYTPTDALLVSAAGPVVTLAQAVVVAVLLGKTKSPYLYPFVFVPVLMRALAGGMNVINPNDEGRISEALGLGLYTLPLLMTGVLLVLVVYVARTHRYGWRLNAVTFALALAACSALILGDQIMPVRLL